MTQTVGERIAKYRKVRGWSAARLGEVVGLSREVVANIETGRREDITVNQLMRFARALDVSPVTLVVEEGDEDAAAEFLAEPSWQRTLTLREAIAIVGLDPKVIPARLRDRAYGVIESAAEMADEG